MPDVHAAKDALDQALYWKLCLTGLGSALNRPGDLRDVDGEGVCALLDRIEQGIGAALTEAYRALA